MLKPGGPLFAAFIARYVAHRDCAAGYPELLCWPHAVITTKKTPADGKLPPPDDDHVAFVAYFAHPTEVAPAVLVIRLRSRRGARRRRCGECVGRSRSTSSMGSAWDRWA